MKDDYDPVPIILMIILMAVMLAGSIWTFLSFANSPFRY